MAENITTVMPPPILQYFNRWLLCPWEGAWQDFIIFKHRCERKIRPQDTSKRKRFNELEEKLRELYERAKITQRSIKKKKETH